MITLDDELRHELATRAHDFERVTPDEILAWTFERFGDSVAYACSFEDVALLDMVVRQRPNTEVIFLDTGGHFPETEEFVNRLEAAWSLRLVRTEPGPDAAPWPCGTAECCQRRKVAPLQAALAGRSAWLSSVKRVDNAHRAELPVVEWDAKFGLVKVSPLATWSDDDVAYYLKSHDLPEHPLWSQGYASIGCAAVTVRPLPGEGRRSGRWAGSDKEECGLHE